VSSPSFPAAPAYADRLRRIVDGLARVVGDHANANRGNLATIALVLLLQARLFRFAREFAAFAARAAAGRALPVRARGPRRGPVAAGPDAPAPNPAPPPATAAAIGAPKLPRDDGWVVRMGGWKAAHYHALLGQMLAEPEMQALLEAVPRARRILRPLLRMLAIDVLPTGQPPFPGEQIRRAGPRPAPPPPRAASPYRYPAPSPWPDSHHTQYDLHWLPGHLRPRPSWS
jgi:hypothetical protein